jgi:uncharacterized SAM-binding protein YcdF (DUF218 family)
VRFRSGIEIVNPVNFIRLILSDSLTTKNPGAYNLPSLNGVTSGNILKLDIVVKLKHRFKQMGFDGLVTYLLSNLLIVLTLGGTVIPVFLYVTLLAIKTNSHTRYRTILVLGERLQNNLPGPNYIARLDRACSILKSKKIQHVYIVGGITGSSTISESACGQSYIMDNQLGSDPSFTLHIEDKSQHTLENLKFVRDMISENQINAVGMITNRFHLARASVLAKGLGMTHDLCSAESHFKNSVIQWLLMIREAYLIHWYFTGKYWSILTNNKASLERVR